ncbi:rCG43737 [Rattus norvegicus]|uniref:RCG43737 n=1 Tax=Rattus norvegicus TaxID=10116 RepID=A6JIL0_RAT|nr:rCG43737 [Rattus norvegicus]
MIWFLLSPRKLFPTLAP